MMLSRRGFIHGAVAISATAIIADRSEARDIKEAVENIVGGGADIAATRQYLRTYPVGLDRLWAMRPSGDEIISVFRKAEPVFQPIPEQLSLLNFFWRDVKDHDKQIAIHPYLFAILSGVQTAASNLAGRPVPLILTSGYRTPERNASIEGAAKDSKHPKGEAGDIKIPSFSPTQVATIARYVGAGGVGVYSNFTHIDVGTVRDWQG